MGYVKFANKSQMIDFKSRGTFFKLNVLRNTHITFIMLPWTYSFSIPNQLTSERLLVTKTPDSPASPGYKLAPPWCKMQSTGNSLQIPSSGNWGTKLFTFSFLLCKVSLIVVYFIYICLASSAVLRAWGRKLPFK